MLKSIIPSGYKSSLTLYETQNAISLIKYNFQEYLSKALNLRRVSAPLFLDPSSGLNDDLNGVERAVNFDIPAAGIEGVVVQSLAKWKRFALWRYDFHEGKGIYTDMNAIRRDETLDNIHSIYVDQWDWEKVITPDTRNLNYLKIIVRAIIDSIIRTADVLRVKYPQNIIDLDPTVHFITTQELEDLWPDLSPKEREYNFVKNHKTTFILGIGDKLKSGQPHDGRAPDYDDWSLNGDILFYNPILDDVIEISSMGIRVDSKTLDEQLNKSNTNERRTLPFHKMLLDGDLPLTIGGGIGQSRLCMLLLGKAHIGEVQSSIWDEYTQKVCNEAGIVLL